MSVRSPWSTFAQDTQRAVPAGVATVLPSIALPSIPYLDELSRSPGFDQVNCMVALAVGIPANWTLTVDIQYQPVKNGPMGTTRLVAVGISFLQQVPAAPGMTMTCTVTNVGAVAANFAVSYGGAACPGLTHPDGGSHGHPGTYSPSLMGPLDEESR